MIAPPDMDESTDVDESTARTWIDVDLGVLGRNVRALRDRLPESCGVLMVVKADAYGHGIEPAARAARAAGVWGFAVAALDEAARLRKAGFHEPVVCLMPILPAEAGRALELEVVPAITSLEQAEAFDAAARVRGRVMDVHADVDTGMGRTGAWDRDAVDLIARVAKLPGLRVTGIFTHFASADEARRGPTEQQLDRFDAVLAELETRGVRVECLHAANSAAALRFARASRLGAQGGESPRVLVRPGIAVYGAAGEIAPDDDAGCWRAGEGAGPPPFEPALSWHARVLAVKELAPGDAVSYHGSYVARASERIALLGVGYADGWPLALSNRGSVLLRGRLAPIRGTVCMDLTMVDATPFPDLRAGEVATLIGRQDGVRQSAEDVAAAAGGIAYSVLTGIGRRVRRNVLEEER
ncbi:MAG TPA: alanine racemase [Gemmatimonadota bacterium]|nr:alanine racemase [Gemmatimonadota bacterium]